MTISWDKNKYFARVEFDDPNYPGSGEKREGILLFQLTKLRDTIKCPIITHTKVGGCVDMDGTHGHSSNSFHLFKNGCKAVDFHIAADKMSVREKCYYVMSVGFSGIGIYYNWYWNGKKLDVGFHVDIRPKSQTQYWTCIEKGKYIYFFK